MRLETKLDFEGIKLHGRDDEITCVQQAFNKVKLNEEKQTIFISGDSGSGKTSLVKHFCSSQIKDAIFVQGKFDAVSNQPMSAINEALFDLCNQVAVSDRRQIIKDSLRHSLGCNFNILQKALPNCMSILGYDSPSDDIPHEKCESSTLDRLYRSFRDLIHVCLDGGKVIIFFIDDLHWADDQSWEFILQLIRDMSLKRLLIIGAYRKDELSCERDTKIQSLSKENIASVLNLNGWDFQKVNDLLASLLQMRTTQTDSLASLIFSKSAGNPYFTIEVLKAIKKYNLLQFSFIKTCWEWDTLRIESSINIGDNLVDIILSKFNDLPYHSQKILILSSCFGPKFDAKVVESVLTQYLLYDAKENIGSFQLKSYIENAASEGILDVHRGSSIYRFAHDKIYEAIFSQVSKFGNPNEIHLKIGRLLLHFVHERPEDEYLTFLAARQSHYSLHFIETSSEAVQWAKLNLKAAKSAILLSAFRPAAEYLHQGLLFNRDLSWIQYDLQLEFLILQARVQLCLGDFPKCYAAVNEVIENARNINDKIPVFEVHIDALGTEGKIEECFRLGLLYAKMLGINLPPKFNMLTVIYAFYKAKQAMTKKTVAKLSNYPMATNPSKIVAIRILSSLVIAAFQARLVNMMVTLSLINTTLIVLHAHS
jgi:predicted ATPase